MRSVIQKCLKFVRVLKRVICRRALAAATSSSRDVAENQVLLLNNSSDPRSVDPTQGLNSGGGRPVVCWVPLAQCRTFRGMFALNQDCMDPRFLFAQRYKELGNIDLEASPFRVWREAVAPRCAADLLGIKTDPSSYLRQKASLAWRMPWDRKPTRQQRRARVNYLERSDLASDKHEVERVVAIVDSIRSNGYQPESFGYATGWLLDRGDSDFAVLIAAGNHRAAVLLALGYDSIPIRFKPSSLVTRCSVNSWPGVRAGAFTVEEALQVFDRVFCGECPEFLSGVWPDVLAR